MHIPDITLTNTYTLHQSVSQQIGNITIRIEKLQIIPLKKQIKTGLVLKINDKTRVKIWGKKSPRHVCA